MERRLGRGLGSLLGASPTETELQSSSELPVERISPNPFQPRKHFDPAGLEELRESIRRHGVLQPVVVRRSGEAYQLVSGERRWRCARLLGMKTLPAVVRDRVGDDSMLELALIENVQRRDLGPLEKAQGYRDLMHKLGLTQEQVAERVALKRATVANHLRLLELPAKVQEALTQDLISMGHARALLSLADEKAQLDLTARIVRDGLSVRDVEDRVRRAGSPKAPGVATSGSSEGPRLAPGPPWLIELQNRLRDALGTQVQIKNGAQFRGQIVVDYFNRDDLERLVEQLAPRPKL